jgi:hypothetical protein
MSEFTKEQLIEWAQKHKKRAEEYLVAVPNDEYGHKDLALAEIALASLTAEPVYFVEIEDDQDINAGRVEGKKRFDLGLLPDGINFLYATPPVVNSDPIYQVQYGNDWRDVERGQYDDHTAHGSPVRIVYAAPPAPASSAELEARKHVGYLFVNKVNGGVLYSVSDSPLDGFTLAGPVYGDVFVVPDDVRTVIHHDGGRMSKAAADVLAERRRQVTAEGWTPEHDDKYQHSEMLWAACCYVFNTIQKYNRVPFDWPWRDEWWKPTNQRRDLVKANALLLAEIERIDRAAGIGKGE